MLFSSWKITRGRTIEPSSQQERFKLDNKIQGMFLYCEWIDKPLLVSMVILTMKRPEGHYWNKLNWKKKYVWHGYEWNDGNCMKSTLHLKWRYPVIKWMNFVLALSTGPSFPKGLTTSERLRMCLSWVALTDMEEWHCRTLVNLPIFNPAGNSARSCVYREPSQRWCLHTRTH